MPAHAEASTKQIRLAVGEAPGAAAVWRAQRALRAAGGGRHERRLAERVIAAQAVLGGRVFRVPDAELGELRRRIERLDRRARKLGAAPIRLLDTGERDGTASFVVLCGQAPRLAGWTLAAIVSHRDHRRSCARSGSPVRTSHAARFAEAALRALRVAPPARRDLRRHPRTHRGGAPGRVGVRARLRRWPRPRTRLPPGRVPRPGSPRALRRRRGGRRPATSARRAAGSERPAQRRPSQRSRPRSTGSPRMRPASSARTGGYRAHRHAAPAARPAATGRCASIASNRMRRAPATARSRSRRCAGRERCGRPSHR